MTNSYFVSAYATSPSFDKWDQLIEKEYFQQLIKRTEIVGIEHPLFIHPDKYSLAWLKENIPSHWSIIITTLPTFMHMAKTNPFLGLASTHEKDRYLAVKVMKKASIYVRDLNEMFGRQIVKAVHFHSLPKNEGYSLHGHKEALKQSLYNIKDMNWDGAQLNLEHCDAYNPSGYSDKGLLSLQDEIEAVSEAGGCGIVLNWGRSAIETRSVNGPLIHIKMTKDAGLLKGFFFSGCTDSNKSEYGAWKDTHIPPKNFIEGSYLKEESLLGFEEIYQVFGLLNQDIYFGVKVFNPSKLKTLEKSVGLNIDTINALESVVNSINPSINVAKESV